MCQTIEFENEVIKTGADLKRIVGTHNIVMIGTDTLYDDECLCLVDVGATAAKAGMKHHRSAEMWADWVLERYGANVGPRLYTIRELRITGSPDRRHEESSEKNER